MNNIDFNWDAIDNTAQEAIPLSFPAVFWQHGSSQLAELGEKHWKYRGGLFFITDDNLGDSLAGWSQAKFNGDKDEVRGYAATSAHVALIRSRRRWFQDDGSSKTYRPWDQYQQGFRAQMQVIGFIHGYDEPVSFSFKGLVVGFINNIIKEHYNKVVSVANKTAPAGKKLPAYAIWLALKSGKFEKAGSGQRQSEVTYPEIVLPKIVDHEYCVKRYVGNDNLIKFQELYHELDGWAKEWEGGGLPIDEKKVAYEMQHPNIEESPYPAAVSEPHDDDEPPF